ncbi:MAG TPA: Npt1/Npt2 family nucleotide transporter [Longimicrobiales bacterium]|nr:Npt1/Npt2 family nucleotide transporter [Longimicrobiales bacterium]
MRNAGRQRGASWIGSLFGVTAPGELRGFLALMALFFLIVCAVGILRPIKNALALDGLGATDFYRVYLVSAAVVLFVPAFNRMADRLPWRALFAAVALFFALNLVLFRLWYVEGSAAFGLIFYGWYDLFAAALVTQFFMATQFYFDARSARRAYPIIIAGGSIGATIGGGITGFFAQSVGTPNLLLVAAVFISAFAFCIPWVLRDAAPRAEHHSAAAAPSGTFREIFSHRQVRLIAAAVLLTVIVKQLVDYQFNVVTKDVFETRDAVSAFQGKFNAATQWLPLIVLAGLRPALRRWGIGTAVLLLPFFMLVTTAGLALMFGLVAAVAAKGAETSLRYSAERTGREILYVPVPDEIKLKAKAYIDVAVEKGIGKVASALLIMALLPIMGYRQIAWVAVGFAALWLALAISVRREYVLTLARSIEGRFASLRGVYASLLDANTLPVLRAALTHPSPLRAAFGLELVEQLPPRDVSAVAPELNALTAHPEEHIRVAALKQFARAPAGLNTACVRDRLLDSSAEVRTAAIHALLAEAGDGAPSLLHELLQQERPEVRIAALNAVIGNGTAPALRARVRSYVESQPVPPDGGSTEMRVERALAAAAVPDGARQLAPLLHDPDAGVRAAALRAAGVLGAVVYGRDMVAALGDRRTRDAARHALGQLGEPALEPLAQALLDPRTDATVRRLAPAALARMPSRRTVDLMLRLALAPETDQLLDHRTIRALSKVRAHNPDVVFDRELVDRLAADACDAAARYAAARPAARAVASGGNRLAALFVAALDDAWAERREGVFRCLGMIHPPAAIHSAYDALVRGGSRERANAREWLEHTLGVSQFRRLSAVLEPATTTVTPRTPELLLTDADPWVALLARALTTPAERDMELIEKVFLLQQVDLLQDARGAHIALLASIAEEVAIPADAVLLETGAVPDAMYVVTRGSIRLHGGGHSINAGPEYAFGTWALIDDQPSPVSATAVEPSRVLRLTRDDFQDLLADHPELALGLLRGLARRMRRLVA